MAMKVVIYFAAVLAAAGTGVGSAWLLDVIASLERKRVRAVVRVAAVASALTILIGAAMVGFQNISWPGGWGVIWGIGQVVLLLAALAICFGGMCALISV